MTFDLRNLFVTKFLVLMLATVAFGQSKPPAKARSKKSGSASLSSELKQLREALDAQQQQIQQLRTELQSRDQTFQQLQSAQQTAAQSRQQAEQAQAAAADAQAKLAATQSALDDQKETISRYGSTLADLRTSFAGASAASKEELKRVSSLEGLVGRFRFNGDVRVRGESFYQSYSGCTACQDRQRARVRVRFGVDGKLNEDFTAGWYLATGSLGDPTTTNETFTNFFDRKTIGLDRGFITYNPVAHKWLSLTGGKFAYQWQRTQVTGDPDINPEGFNEKLSFDLKTPYLKNVTLQGIQLMFNEISKGPDSFAAGGQVSTRLELGRWTATPSFLVLNWRNPDNILQASAFAVQATSTGSSSKTTPVASIPAPGEGPGCASGSSVSNLPKFAPCVFSPNGMTNSTFTDAAGVPHFSSAFLYADVVINNTVKTPWSRLPFNALLEYENNLNAQDHPVDYKGNTATWLGKQSHTYLADVSLGQTKNRGDIQFGYAYLREEQDAAIASFAESDQRAPTNILQHRFYALYKLRSNTVGSFTWWHGRTLNDNLVNAALASGFKADGTTKAEPWLNRMQFDLSYIF